MKTIILILFLSSLTIFSQQFVNTNTGQYASTLPTQILIGGNYVSNPTSNMLVSVGWLTVSNTVAPTTGWVTTSNAVVPYIPINGWCQLIPAASNSIAGLFSAAITNNPLWTSGFTNTLGTWRSVLRAYNGVGQETNAVVNWSTSSQYFATNAAFLSTPSNVFNAIWLNDGANQIVQLRGITNTAQFFQWVTANGIF